MVVDGKIVRSARARLVRDGRPVWEGKIATLKRFKDDAREVAQGYECGIALENFNDVKPDDIIEAFEMEAILRKLAAPTARDGARPGGGRKAASALDECSVGRSGARREARWRRGRIAMVVGVMRLTLFLPENHSLKGKRQVLRAIKGRVQQQVQRLDCRVRQPRYVAARRAGHRQVGSDRAFVDRALREVVNFIDSLGLAPLGEEQLEIINY